MNFEIKNEYSRLSMDSHGNIVSWVFNETGKDIELFFPRQKVKDKNGLEIIRGGSHFCYPIFGTDPLGELPRHGFLRDMEVLVGAGDGSSIVFEFHKNPKMEGRYKNFQLPVLTRRLDSEGYELFEEIKIDTSEGFEDYFNLGIHPYFRTPKGSFELFIKDQYGILRKITKFMIEENGVEFFYTKFPEFDLFCPGVGTFKWKLGYDSYLPILTSGVFVWRDSEEYVCVEPVYKKENSIFDKGKNFFTFQSITKFVPA